MSANSFHHPTKSAAGGDAQQAARKASEATPHAAALYLDKERKSSDGDGQYILSEEVVDVRYEVRRCYCRSAFCPECCWKSGNKLRERLLDIVYREFQDVLMWTLTIDREQFESAEECFRYCRKQAVVGRLMRELRSKGYLNSNKYFCAVEFQDDGWVHFHLLVDAKYVPIEAVREAWNRFRPKHLGEGRVGFGAVMFSKRRRTSKLGSVFYVTKYVTKYPEKGFPDWLLDAEDMRPRRYQVSKGFWAPVDASPTATPDPKEEQDACAPEAAPQLEVETDDSRPKRGHEKKPRRTRTVRETLAICGENAVIMKIETVRGGDGELFERWNWFSSPGWPFDECAARVGCEEGENRIVISHAQALMLGQDPAYAEEWVSIEPRPDPQQLLPLGDMHCGYYEWGL